MMTHEVTTGVLLARGHGGGGGGGGSAWFWVVFGVIAVFVLVSLIVRMNNHRS